MCEFEHFPNEQTNTDYPILIITTLPAEGNDNWVKELVTAGLAGCVTKFPAGESTYRWQGNTVTDHESVWLIKSTAKRLDELNGCIRKNHPYEVPEIAIVKIDALSALYWSWLQEVTGN